LQHCCGSSSCDGLKGKKTSHHFETPKQQKIRACIKISTTLNKSSSAASHLLDKVNTHMQPGMISFELAHENISGIEATFA
jgi:hypothetical protein